MLPAPLKIDLYYLPLSVISVVGVLFLPAFYGGASFSNELPRNIFFGFGMFRADEPKLLPLATPC